MVSGGSMPGFPALKTLRKKWFVTGAAGFIGSHLVEGILRAGGAVVGFDNLSSGRETNLQLVRGSVGTEAWQQFRLLQGDIGNPDTLGEAIASCDVVLHHAALGSVPDSLERPMETHASNATGFLNVLQAARSAGIRRVVYASSSSVYGDCPDLPLQESSAGAVLSPYAASKLTNEVYSRTYAAAYGMELIGLRYFNVFGPRQDPNGAYAAVIPKWIQAILSGQRVTINGDGANTRDFCPVEDVVTANILAAQAGLKPGTSLALNIGSGRATTLLELFESLRAIASKRGYSSLPSTFGPARSGDIRHSTADLGAAKEALDYAPSSSFMESLERTFVSFISSTPREIP